MAELFLFMKKFQIQSVIEPKSSIMKWFPNHFFTYVIYDSFKNYF